MMINLERSQFMSALEEIRNRFKNDHFATETTGIVIDLAEPGKAVCSTAAWRN